MDDRSKMLRGIYKKTSWMRDVALFLYMVIIIFSVPAWCLNDDSITDVRPAS